MACVTCHWWRPAPDTQTDDNDIPVFGRCIACAPRPQIFAVEDVNKWNTSTMAVVWPQTKPDDHCAGHVDVALVDQQTGRLKQAIAPPGYGTDEEAKH